MKNLSKFERGSAADAERAVKTTGHASRGTNVYITATPALTVEWLRRQLASVPRARRSLGAPS